MGYYWSMGNISVVITIVDTSVKMKLFNMKSQIIQTTQ